MLNSNSDRARAIEMITDAQENHGISLEKFADYLIANYLSGAVAVDAVRSYLVDECGMDAYEVCEDEEN